MSGEYSNFDEALEKFKASLENDGIIVLDRKQTHSFLDFWGKTFPEYDLNNIVSECTKEIIDCDPSFFQKYKLQIPDDPTDYIINKIYDNHKIKPEHKPEAIKSALHKTKLYFWNIPYYMDGFKNGYPDQELLLETIGNFKESIECRNIQNYRNS